MNLVLPVSIITETTRCFRVVPRHVGRSTGVAAAIRILHERGLLHDTAAVVDVGLASRGSRGRRSGSGSSQGQRSSMVRKLASSLSDTAAGLGRSCGGLAGRVGNSAEVSGLDIDHQRGSRC